MNGMSEHLRVELDGSVAVVTMAKPPHNLLNGEFIDGLISEFKQMACLFWNGSF